MATLMEKIFGPLSAGSLRLASTDVKVNHIVRFHYFRNPGDGCGEGTGFKADAKFLEKRWPLKKSQSFAPLFVSCSSMWNSSDQLEHAPSKNTGVESTLKYHSDIKKSEFKFQDQDSTSTLSTGQSNHMEAVMGKSKTVLQNFTAHPG
ncbi:hypothetical protein BC332_18632 [Capsicum chinense]|nr:hypothetical protein BC332_18632 [Capsicum chinense]